jgi:uncharacterized membrane protein
MFLVFIVCAAFCLLSRRSGLGFQNWEPPWRRTDRSGHAGGDKPHSALQILNERFAKSEIQKQEYEEKKAAILSSGHG